MKACAPLSRRTRSSADAVHLAFSVISAARIFGSDHRLIGVRCSTNRVAGSTADTRSNVGLKPSPQGNLPLRDDWTPYDGGLEPGTVKRAKRLVEPTARVRGTPKSGHMALTETLASFRRNTTGIARHNWRRQVS